MSFEDSPSLDDPEQPNVPIGRWLQLHQRRLWALIGILAVILIMTAGLAVGPVLRPSQPGGLDGCLQTPAGKALSATVTIGSLSRSTYADGCFFFISLPPGEYQLIISGSPHDLQIPVKIESNKATGLGTITVPQ